MKSKSSSKSARSRRKFTAEFKAEAVSLRKKPGHSVVQVAKDLGVADGVLRNWIKQSNSNQENGSSSLLTASEKEELAILRRENKQLRLERDILKKATPSSRKTIFEVRLH
ncbi:MAG: transposase [Oligoflexus sp.]|nr:transposase [Oligoflexus sp.]